MLAAAWFGAVSTFLLVIGAGYTVWYARGAFAKQSDELTILQGQAADQLRIPIESDHLFRSNPIADSGVSDHLAGVGVS